MLIEQMGLTQDALAGKVTLITGAGRGIGKELALALAWLGARVVIAEIAPTGAEVEAQIRSMGREALYIQTDLADEASIRSLAEQTLAHFGRVDILVNNAAMVKTGSLLELPLSTWDQIYAVNARAVVQLTQAFLLGMLERRDGVVVMVASAEGIAFQSPYSFTKVGQQSMAISLAGELGPDCGVSVFVFGPGMVDTPAVQEYVRELAPRYGMTFESFTHMGANPGYDGLMPAEHCAAGFAYDIVHAKEFHGQIADAFQPLARQGLLNLSEKEAPGREPAAPAETPKPQPAAPTGAAPADQAREVLSVLQTIDREYNELDIFRRGWVTRDFQKNTGMSVKDWLETASNLVVELEAAPGSPEAQPIRAKLSWLQDRLERLAAFFRKNQNDARGYIRDPQQLRLALAALEQREAAVRLLLETLARTEYS